MNFNPEYENIANAFIQHYYAKFDQSDPMARAQGLSDLYDPEHSYMTFEGVQCKGRNGILEKFTVRFLFLFYQLNCLVADIPANSAGHYEVRFTTTLRWINSRYGSWSTQGYF